MPASRRPDCQRGAGRFSFPQQSAPKRLVAPMPTLTPTLVVQLLRAVDEARHARHHQCCDCASLRVNGAPYCTASEARWEQRVDDILDQIIRLNH